MKSLMIIELKRLIREKYLFSFLIVFIVSLLIASYFSVVQTNEKILNRDLITEKVRKEWEELDNMNPHTAAHFGTYAFKPITVLSAFDEGINSYTGNVLRLEGHIQHDIVHSELSHFPLISYFGKLTPSFLLQYILSVFIIFIAFVTINGDKESGRLKLYVVQGAELSKILFSKVLTVWFISILLTVTTISTQIFINIKYLIQDDLLRSFVLLLSYSFYYLILILLTIYSSIVLKSAANGKLDALSRADDAIGVALNFMNQNPNTTLLTASDSEAGGLEVAGYEIDNFEQLKVLPERDRNGSPLDGKFGTATEPFISKPDKNGKVFPFGIAWSCYGDVTGGVVARAHGLNADKMNGKIDNTDIYRIMYMTLFGIWLD